MAKISKQQREQNLQRFDQVVLETFLTEGWHNCTFGKISKKLNIQRSTLQSYYPAPVGFKAALDGKVFPIFSQNLDLSCRESFIDSWIKSLEDAQFRYIVQMFISASVNPDLGTDMALGGVNRLRAALAHLENAESVINEVFGLSVLKFMETK